MSLNSHNDSAKKTKATPLQTKAILLMFDQSETTKKAKEKAKKEKKRKDIKKNKIDKKEEMVAPLQQGPIALRLQKAKKKAT